MLQRKIFIQNIIFLFFFNKNIVFLFQLNTFHIIFIYQSFVLLLLLEIVILRGNIAYLLKLLVIRILNKLLICIFMFLNDGLRVQIILFFSLICFQDLRNIVYFHLNFLLNILLMLLHNLFICLDFHHFLFLFILLWHLKNIILVWIELLYLKFILMV